MFSLINLYRNQPKPFIFLIALLVGTGVAGQGTTPADTALASLLPKSCELAGEFSQQKQVADLPKSLDSTGRFIFSCQQGLIWITQEPFRETLVYRKDGQHSVIIPGAEVEPLKGRIHRELGKILNNLIGADVDYLNAHFQLGPSQSPTQLLIPKNKRLRNYIAGITLSPLADGTQINIMQGEGESIAITIRKTEPLQNLNANHCANRFPDDRTACELLFP